MGDSTATLSNMPDSKFLDHVANLPAVKDSISAYKSNPYGAKSLEIAEYGYDRLIKPVTPYAEKPYAYISPYVNKADELADSALTNVESRFPILKSDTDGLKDKAIDVVGYPLKLVDDAQKYVLNKWHQQYKSAGGNGYIAGTKALVTTSLIVTADSLVMAIEFLQNKTKEVADKVDDDTLDKAQKKGSEVADKAQKKTSEVADKAGKKTDEVADKAGKKTDEVADKASKKGHEVKGAAADKANEIKN